jgi:hypothetical protein
MTVSVTRRRFDRRTRLAGNLPRQRTAGYPDFVLAHRYLLIDGWGTRLRANFDNVGTLLLALTLEAYALDIKMGHGRAISPGRGESKGAPLRKHSVR